MIKENNLLAFLLKSGELLKHQIKEDGRRV
jgi:hypothetical protein